MREARPLSAGQSGQQGHKPQPARATGPSAGTSKASRKGKAKVKKPARKRTQKAASGTNPVVQNPSSAQDTRSYWSTDQMNSAQPVDSGISGDGRSSPPASDNTDGSTVGGSGSATP
jgi:hypothetical protein